jgi:predicted HTH domain antitoxin
MAEVKTGIREVVTDFPLFHGYEEKERFFLVLGLLLSKQISFARAAELAGLSRVEFSFLLDKLGIAYEFLTEADIESERESAKRLLKELERGRGQ